MTGQSHVPPVLNEFLGKVVVQVVNPIILLLSAGALVVFLWGAFEFIVNAGNAERRKEGRDALFWGIIGLVIMFGAYGVINVALNTFNVDTIAPGMFKGGQ